MNDAVLLGIDGGGSKTVALVAAADGRVLGRGSAGASNYHSVGMEPACAALEQAVGAAFMAAGMTLAMPAAVGIGLAGVDRPDDQARFVAWAARLWPNTPVAIVNDAELVLAAGTPDGWGIALICGTGSIAVGRDRDGQVTRAGGWGHLLGDEGSGYAIGLAALRAAARAADGRGAATRLTATILEYWSLPNATSLIERVYREQTSRADIAQLAGLVEQAAAAGDAVAQRIMSEAYAELALAAEAVAQRLGFAEAIPCALAGGLIVNRPPVVAGVLAAAHARHVQLDPVACVTEPAEGALVIARRLRRTV